MVERLKDAIEKIKENKDVAVLWDNWGPVLYNDEKDLNEGMLPLFLCDEYSMILEDLGSKKYYKLLREMAKFAYDTDKNLMVVTPNPGQLEARKTNPLREVFATRDPKALNIVLEYTPAEAINMKMISYSLEIGDPSTNKVIESVDVNYFLTNALYCDIGKASILKTLKKTTNVAALTEALSHTENDKHFKWRLPYMDGLKKEDVEEIREKIKQKIFEIENPQQSGLMGKLSMFANQLFGTNNSQVQRVR